MSQVIDHAILIPAPPRAVWERISRPDQNPRWQADCDAISYLNMIRSGPGMRWRSTSPSGQESVIEIQSWYEGLGFEYTIVDGGPFRMNRGRLRLQETAEGTVVQWTFTYEVKGALAGLRNALSIKRSIDQNIVNSLKNLYQMIRSESVESAPGAPEVKSLMRDAPSVEERLKYKPRHPSVMDQIEKGEKKPETAQAQASSDAIFRRPIVAETAKPSAAIAEPPLADEDTKPNRPLSQPAPAAPATPEPHQPIADKPEIEEPAFLKEIPPSSVEASSPAQEATVPGTFSAEKADVRQSTEIPITRPERRPEPAPREVFPEPLLVERDTETDQEQIRVTPPASAGSAQPAYEAEPRSALDTGRVSVFEIFGLQKPSETQELRAVLQEGTMASARSTATATQEMVANPLKRRGFRAFQRRRRVKLRLPF